MIRTDVDSFSPEERATNEAACRELVPGGTYRFEPPVRATAIPTGGLVVCEALEGEFETGWYLGYHCGAHVFQGKPRNDQRRIRVPQEYEDIAVPDGLLDDLRASYFHVAFIGGRSVPTLINPGPQG